MLAPVFAGLLLLCLQWQYLFICPLPTDGNETAKIGGMEVLTGQHRSPYYIQKSKHLQHDKLAYRKIDDTDNPLRPFVIATRKELPALPSYAKLKFKQPVQPTNGTNVLREGYSYAETSEELAARAAATLIVRREQRHAYREAVERRLYVCANCQAEELYSWHKLKDVEEDQGDLVCRHCESYWVS
ncbi:hypothetical protein KCU99_g5131, partial [Aureobasidium melanogenum]